MAFATGIPPIHRRRRIASGRGKRASLAACASLAMILPALAACPIELATYRDRDETASIEFRPGDAAATVTNSFRVLLDSDMVLDGIVMWSEGIERPNGLITLDCPTGDVTGAEYEACTAWQGVIYTADAAGAIGLLPGQGAPAPTTLILADLAYAVRAFPPLAGRDVKLSWDVFTLSGCQE